MTIGDVRIPSDFLSRSFPPLYKWSAWSNVVFLSGLILPFFHLSVHSVVASIGCILAGFGSYLWHATGEAWAQRLDEWSIYAMLTSAIGLSLSVILELPSFWDMLILYSVLVAWILAWLTVHELDSFIFTPALGLVLLFMVIVGDVNGIYVGISFTSIVIAVGFQFLGNRREHGVLHALWHVFALIAVLSAEIGFAI